MPKQTGSLIEKCLAEELNKRGILFETQPPLPVDNWPWKSTRNHGSPKADFLLLNSRLYVEVKGWMTPLSLAKSAWACAQPHFNYYFFQGSDETWDVDDSPFGPLEQRGSIKQRIDILVDRQIAELVRLEANPGFAGDAARISRARIRRYMQRQVDRYREWAGEFP